MNEKPEWTWRKQASIFFVIFGGIWLFIEPLFAFLGGQGLISQLGIWGYVLLIAISAFSTLTIEYADKIIRINKSTSIISSGIVDFYSKRNKLNSNWWENFFDSKKNPKKVILMGQSISRAFTNVKQSTAFVEWCKRGTEVRILLLSPSNTELAQLQNVGKGIIRTYAEDPTKNLANKIQKSISDLDDYVISKIHEFSKKPLVRYATRDLPFSLMTVGDDMVVTLYGTEAEGDEQPTFIIKDEKLDAYGYFLKEFEILWRDYSKVLPYEDPVLSNYKKDWQRYISLREYNIEIPPPRQAIIFPTYHCNENCSFCMFQDIRYNDNLDEMGALEFKKYLRELIDFGVEHIEISGGGEPLEYSHVNEMIKTIAEIRLSLPHIKFGLLTNGYHLGEHKASDLLYVFNDYIRITRYERITKTGREDDFRKWKYNIKTLLKAKRNNPDNKTKIGIKYLLTPENQDRFVQIIAADLTDRDLVDVDHLRFRSDRRVDKDVINSIEQHIYYIIADSNLFSFPGKVSLSLPKTVYSRNFKCWISPMNVVIAPNGEVYVCCNYSHDRNSKCLGNLSSKSFESLWLSPHHQLIRKNLGKVNCDRDDYCNCRYAEIQEILERIALTAGM